MEVSEAFKSQRRLMYQERFQEASWEVVNALKDKNYQARLQSPFPAAPVQLDAIMGYVNTVQEMPVYSSEDGFIILTMEEKGELRISQKNRSKAKVHYSTVFDNPVD